MIRAAARQISFLHVSHLSIHIGLFFELFSVMVCPSKKLPEASIRSSPRISLPKLQVGESARAHKDTSQI